MKTIAVMNQKGGTGKTTSAINLAGELVRRGKKVLIVDMDTQGNATSNLSLTEIPPATLTDVIVSKTATLADTVCHTTTENLDLIRGGSLLAPALATMQDETFFGTMMMKKNAADGMVSGAIHSTADTLRPALQIIKTKPGVTTASSCFVMEIPNKAYGQDGVMIFADCAVNITPDAQQLAAIAIASAQTAKDIAEIAEPKVAMLSFSTKGSGKGEMVDKVRQATELVKELAPELNVDGELQADAALVVKVGQLKSPGSTVAGHANVLVFPSLEAGNIGYKLVQRLAGAEAIGPVMQGLARPVNDLSRGCSVEDIVSLCALTAVQAQKA